MNENLRIIINSRLVGAIVFALIISSTLVAVYVYYDFKLRECTGEPLIYAAQKYKETYGYEFSGSGSFQIPNSPIIFFNSQKISVEYINSRGGGFSGLNFTINSS